LKKPFQNSKKQLIDENNYGLQQALHDKLATSRLANESAFARLRLGGLKLRSNLQFATHRQPLGGIKKNGTFQSNNSSNFDKF